MPVRLHRAADDVATAEWVVIGRISRSPVAIATRTEKVRHAAGAATSFFRPAYSRGTRPRSAPFERDVPVAAGRRGSGDAHARLACAAWLRLTADRLVLGTTPAPSPPRPVIPARVRLGVGAMQQKGPRAEARGPRASSVFRRPTFVQDVLTSASPEWASCSRRTGSPGSASPASGPRRCRSSSTSTSPRGRRPASNRSDRRPEPGCPCSSPG